MPSNRTETFECSICKQPHKVIPDTLPIEHSGHKSHCLFCLLHTVYRSIIPAHPTTRPTPEQNEKNNIIKTRKIVIFTILPVIVLGYFAFRWQKHYWSRIAETPGTGLELWEARFLWIMLCMVGLAPCGFILGFLVSVVYYVSWCLKKKSAKREKANQTSCSPGAADAVPLEEKPLAELKYQDLQEMNEPIKIVVTPPNEPESPPERSNRLSRMLWTVTENFKGGYNGRAVRRQSWQAIEEEDELRPRRNRQSAAGRTPRPTTEWPTSML